MLNVIVSRQCRITRRLRPLPTTLRPPSTRLRQLLTTLRPPSTRLRPLLTTLRPPSTRLQPPPTTLRRLFTTLRQLLTTLRPLPTTPLRRITPQPRRITAAVVITVVVITAAIIAADCSALAWAAGQAFVESTEGGNAAGGKRQGCRRSRSSWNRAKGHARMPATARFTASAVTVTRQNQICAAACCRLAGKHARRGRQALSASDQATLPEGGKWRGASGRAGRRNRWCAKRRVRWRRRWCRT